MTRAYLSGPMTGHDDFNRPAFAAATAQLRAEGLEVISPGEMSDLHSWEDNLRRDVIELASCTEVRVLDGWENSSGARLEVDTAKRLRMPVRLVDGTPVWLPSRRRIVALSGYAGAGKDAFAARLVEVHGWHRIAFADPLKAVAREIGWNGVKDERGRALLQHLGVAVRDWIATDAWIQAAQQSIGATPPDAHIVITDCRFPNEASWVRSEGGQVWRISRPGVAPANGHVSEVALDGWTFDHHIDNDGGLFDLHNEADRIAQDGAA